MGSSSSSSNSQTTTSIDSRLTTQSGDILGIEHNTIGNVSTGGGNITIKSANADVARQAIETAAAMANNTESTVKSLAQASNDIASKVADSQSQFVAVASGQKYVLYIVGAVAGAALLVELFRKK